MFIKSSSAGYSARTGEQYARGSFLLVFSTSDAHASAEARRRLYACVRHVSLRQLGHFMMGTARIAGQSVTVSGAYGGDGLRMPLVVNDGGVRKEWVGIGWVLLQEKPKKSDVRVVD